MATTLTLMLIGAVVSVFEMVSNSVSDARSTLEMSDRLRATALQLQRDLAGVTVTMLPPRRPEDNEGYFEYIENSIRTTTGSGPNTLVRPDRIALATPYAYTPYAINSESGGDDTTVGDTDDILMFTTRSPDRPFVGRFGSASVTIESKVAEVAWFVRGRTLYRRQLLVLPGVTLPSGATGFYANCDLSIHAEASGNSNYTLKANTLGDLTKREYRFAHPYHCIDPVRYRQSSASGWPMPFPFDVRRWGLLRLPTLCETSSNYWMACLTFPTTGSITTPGQRMPAAFPQPGTTDFWRGADGIINDGSISQAQAFANANQYRISNPWHERFWDPASQIRLMDDVILTNVLGFDVKVWDAGAPLYSRNVRSTTGTRVVTVAPGDPGYMVSGNPVGYGAYVDLGYLPNYVARSGVPRPHFHMLNWDISGGPQSRLYRVYDTWSTHYEYDGISQFGGRTDWATNGLDDDGKNGVDDAGERETQAPYPYPLRSLQVKIRTFEPDSRQIREVTIVQDFMPQ